MEELSVPSIGGNVTKQELESYSGVKISLMSIDNNDVQTSQGGGTGGMIQWSLIWNENGFTGNGWPENIRNENAINNLSYLEKVFLAQLLSSSYPDSCVTYYETI